MLQQESIKIWWSGNWSHCAMFLSEFMLICARWLSASSLLFVLWNIRPIGIAEMKRATTMNKIQWSWDKGFVHGEVQFNIKQLGLPLFWSFEVCRASRIQTIISWQAMTEEKYLYKNWRCLVESIWKHSILTWGWGEIIIRGWHIAENKPRLQRRYWAPGSGGTVASWRRLRYSFNFLHMN
jgi:hypothetical protein